MSLHISFSQLCRLERAIKGETEEVQTSERTLEAGRQFHIAALQPDKYDIDKDGYASLTNKMMRSLKENSLYNQFMSVPSGRSEHEYYWRCKFTDKLCMAKIDRVVVMGAFDLKGTSAANQAEFNAVIVAYNYHMQAAFYLDGAKLNIFHIIAVQKKYPYNTFTYSFSRTHKLIEEGREKYIDIIKKSENDGLKTTKIPY